ncbi:DUF1642 domain-containing protein [Listeria monocytogenes]|nr:DUF1642 domain-containing protein [Listeria monocytogenes]
MKFEVGERVQFVNANKLRTGRINKFSSGTGELYAHIEVDDTQVCVRVTTDNIAKLDQPEPVKVPKDIAELISDYESEVLDGYSNQDNVLECILLDWEGGDLDPDYSKWIDDNLIKIIDAVRNGYVVEEEQKYYVKVIYTADGFLNQRNDGILSFKDKEENHSFRTKFTEKEIKAIDERLWAFAVPVEEVEVSE